MTPAPLRLATRKSALALWQAEHVAARLRALQPERRVDILPMSTEGDRNLGASLSKIGGKGLFIKELEQALADGRADVAVHSMKDLPVLLEPRFAIGAVLEREDPRDAFLSRRYDSFDALPQSARVGSSSLRRQCQLLHRRPDLTIEPLRGNVDTRLSKLERGEYDAVVLAVAGLKRLGLAHTITSAMAVEISLPAITQGVIGIECRADDRSTAALLARLNHGPTWSRCLAERALSRGLSGSCNLPIAGYAELEGATLSLRGRVGSPDGRRLVEGRAHGPVEQAEEAGLRLARELLARGADRILKDVLLANES
jgi:hydroxymethylbilane synthase